MDSLDGTSWDIVISGTGLPQSLLALALSRSDKKVLHLDQNDYYGDQEAALSLQEAEAWVEKIAQGNALPFKNAVKRDCGQDAGQEGGLSFSRAYSLALAPQLIYNRSNLLPALVSSKVYQQLEFLAVGGWWVYERDHSQDDDNDDSHTSHPSPGRLRKIPSSREDVVNDEGIDLRSKRSVWRFLQLAGSEEACDAAIAEAGSMSFHDFLTSRFKIPENLQAPFHALTLAPHAPSKTTTAYALPRIHRHLTSMGLFGPGFGAVIPKWGGLAEIAQVGCRAGAVGGGVYVLDMAIEAVDDDDADDGSHPLRLRLAGDKTVKAKRLVTLGKGQNEPQDGEITDGTSMARSVSIVSSPLQELFPPPAEGAHPAASAVVSFPADSLVVEGAGPSDEQAPVYLMIHSSDTGECPVGQSVIYGQTIATSHSSSLLEVALTQFLQRVREAPAPNILWSITYTHVSATTTESTESSDCHTILSSISPSMVLEDDVLRSVRKVWEGLVSDEQGDGFMTFPEREALGQEEEDITG